MTALRGGAKVFANNPRMTSSDTKQSKRGSLGRTPALFPVAKSMNAYPHGSSEFGLSEVYKIAKSGNIGTGLKLALDKTPAKLRGNGSFELI